MQQRGLATKQLILDTGLNQFSQYGYLGTSVSQICDTAGISKGAFYHHFTSKKALFLQLLKNWLARIDGSLSSYRETSQDVPHALIEMAGSMQFLFDEAGGHLPLLFEFWSEARKDSQIHSEVIAPYHRYQLYFSNLLEEGVQEGSLKPIDTQQAAITLVGMAVGLLLQGILDPEGADWGEVAQRSIALYLEGLAKEIA